MRANGKISRGETRSSITDQTIGDWERRVEANIQTSGHRTSSLRVEYSTSNHEDRHARDPRAECSASGKKGASDPHITRKSHHSSSSAKYNQDYDLSGAGGWADVKGGGVRSNGSGKARAPSHHRLYPTSTDEAATVVEEKYHSRGYVKGNELGHGYGDRTHRRYRYSTYIDKEDVVVEGKHHGRGYTKGNDIYRGSGAGSHCR